MRKGEVGRGGEGRDLEEGGEVRGPLELLMIFEEFAIDSHQLKLPFPHCSLENFHFDGVPRDEPAQRCEEKGKE
eukprot:745897-Hanusia_phi.AAC.5